MHRAFVSIAAAAVCLPVHAAAEQVIHEISLRANGLVYDPVGRTIYASVPSAAGARGDTLTQIHPWLATLGNSVHVGSEPRTLAISDDSRYIYVGLDGSPHVRRFEPATQTAGLLIPMGSRPWNEFEDIDFYAHDIAVMPGSPTTIAVSRYNQRFSPSNEGVAVYDNDVRRPLATPGHTGPTRIEFSGSPGVLYGLDGSRHSPFYGMTVTPAGVVGGAFVPGMFGEALDIHYSRGHIFVTNGRVIDPALLAEVGFLGQGGSITSDPATGRIFLLSENLSPATIGVFDGATLERLGVIEVPRSQGLATGLIRFGDDGLAFVTSEGQVFLVRSGLVPTPGAAAVLLLGGAAGAGRRRRSPHAALNA